MVHAPENIPLIYSRDTQRLYCRGVDLNSPVDSVKEFHFPILENMRSYTDGVLRPRQGLTSINTVIASQTPVHSIRRLNNKLNSTFTRVVGTGTKLATGQSSFSNVQYNGSDVAFSGKPLAMVPWKPDQSPVSWMYVADTSAMYKVSYDGSSVSTHKIGVAPPTTAPTVELAVPNAGFWGIAGRYYNIFAAGSAGSWTSDGVVAGARTFTNRVVAVGITKVIYDSSVPGTLSWASVVPTSMANLGPGTEILVTDGVNDNYTQISEVYRAGGSSSNNVDQIIYSSGSTGACTITPVASIPELKRNAVVRLNGGTNYFRIFEVFTGADGNTISFRCDTGATTISSGQTLEIVSSFRTVLVTTPAVGATYTIQSDTMQCTFTPGATLIGTVTYTGTADLTTFTNSGAAISDSDYFHLSFKAADLSQMTQLRIMFDIDDGTFTKNYFYRAVTPSDLVAAAKATQTVLSTRTTQVQNRNVEIYRRRIPTFVGYDVNGPSSIDGIGGNSSDLSDDRTPLIIRPQNPDPNPSSPRDQTGTGDSQWSEIRFRRGDCTRVGTDWSKGWHGVAKVRMEISMVSGGAATVMEFSSLTFFGSGSPDIGDNGDTYKYRYRYRAPSTGACSNWSPATKVGIVAYRNNIKVSCTAPTNTPEVTVVDIQRAGGTVPIWATIGTVVSPYLFTDTVDDDFASGAIPDSEGDVNYQPWLCAQPSKSGTTAIVAGSMIQDSGTNFLTTWVKGTPIKVNGYLTTIRRVISTSIMELEESVGSTTSAAWEIPEPFIQQSLPCLWGPVNGWFFACGDTTNPGRLYYSNQNDPDSTGAIDSGESWIDVTGPSEPLQNGFVYNGRNYVFSSEKLYEIVEISTGIFIPRETPTGKGLMYRWAFCVGPRVWFLSKDGIYETDGGIARSITFDQLFPLFPKEGQNGVAVNGFNPPNMTTGNLTISGITADVSTFFKLAYYDDYLYFTYPDTNNRIRCLTYAIGNFAFVAQGSPQTGWFPDVFNPGNSNTGIFTIYGEEGDSVHNLLMGGADTTTGKLYSYGGTDDAGTAIPWHFRQASYNAGDERSDKLWGDFIIGADAGGGTITVGAGINQYGTTLTISNPATGAATITGSGRVKSTFDINTGDGVEGRDFAVDLSGTGTTASLYLIQPSFAPRPEDSFRRANQYDDGGYAGEKWVQGIELEADTQNVAKPVQIQYDGGTLAETITIQHNGRRLKPYSFSSGFVAHLMRLAPSDTTLWKLYRWKWVFEPEPPLVTVWDTQQTAHGHIGYIHLKAIWITHTSTADLTLTITRMDDNTSQAFTIPHSGGVRGKESYILLGPAYFCKGKTFKYKITQATNTPFRIYQRHCGVLVKPWGSSQAYARWTGWGADSGDGLAQI